METCHGFNGGIAKASRARAARKERRAQRTALRQYTSGRY